MKNRTLKYKKKKTLKKGGYNHLKKKTITSKSKSNPNYKPNPNSNTRLNTNLVSNLVLDNNLIKL